MIRSDLVAMIVAPVRGGNGPGEVRSIVARRVRRADSFIRRLVGLLGRSALADDEGLWIEPCRGIHTVGMRFPIDVVFLNGGLQVVAVRERVVPWRATRFVRASCSALELPVGAVRRATVRIGDQMDFVPRARERMDPAAGLGSAEVA